jgi:hypothetical protein
MVGVHLTRGDCTVRQPILIYRQLAKIRMPAQAAVAGIMIQVLGPIVTVCGRNKSLYSHLRYRAL